MMEAHKKVPENREINSEKVVKIVKPVIEDTQRVKLEDDFNYTPVLAAFLLIFITLVIFIILKKRSKGRRGILLTGLCDSGKTLLFSRLLHQKYVQTQTSIKENFEEYTINGKSVKIVDIPGHERLRNQFLETYKHTSRGIIYVLDSKTITKDIRDAAEFLYNILTDPVVIAGVRHILIACNKQDQSLSKSSSAICTMLEKEINTLRVTKANQLESVDPNHKDRSVLLGDSDEAFTFESLRRYDVEFVDCFATDKDKSCNIAPLEEWIKQIV